MSDTNYKKSFPKVPDEAIVKDEKPLAYQRIDNWAVRREDVGLGNDV